MLRNPSFPALQLFLFVMGLGMVFLAMSEINAARRFNASSLEATARIVAVQELVMWPSDPKMGRVGPNTRRQPTLEFETNSGETIRTDKLRPSRIFAHGEGDTIRIAYDPENPSIVAISKREVPSAHALIFMLVGASLIGGAAVGSWQSVRGFH